MTRRLFFNYLPFLFLIASFFTSCNRSHEKKSGSKDNTLVVKLVATSIEVAQSYVADVQAVQFVEVKPKVEGFVEDVLVDEGEHVKKGQVLFKLSSAELYEEVKEAQANYKQVLPLLLKKRRNSTWFSLKLVLTRSPLLRLFAN